MAKTKRKGLLTAELAGAEEVSIVREEEPPERVVTSYAIVWDYLEPSEPGEACDPQRYRRHPGRRCITLQLEWITPSNRRGVYGPYWYAYMRRTRNAEPGHIEPPKLISVYIGKGLAKDGRPNKAQLRTAIAKLSAKGAFDISPWPEKTRAKRRAEQAKRSKRKQRFGF